MPKPPIKEISEAAAYEASTRDIVSVEPKANEKVPSTSLKSRIRDKKTQRTAALLQKKKRRLPTTRPPSEQQDIFDNEPIPEFVLANNGGSGNGSGNGASSSSYAHYTRSGRQFFGLPAPTSALHTDDGSVGSSSSSSRGYRRDKEDPPAVVLAKGGLRLGAPSLINASALKESNNHRHIGADVSYSDFPPEDGYFVSNRGLLGERDERHQSFHFGNLWSRCSMSRNTRRTCVLWFWRMLAATAFALILTVAILTFTSVAHKVSSSLQEHARSQEVDTTSGGGGRGNNHRVLPPRPTVPEPTVFDLKSVPASTMTWSQDRVVQILDTVDSLKDPATPQGRALTWILQDVADTPPESKARIIQRYVLATFYHCTTLEGKWKNSDGWLTSAHECTWYGVKCGVDASASFQDVNEADDLTFVVTYLNLAHNNLHGQLPEELSHLEDLASLQLQGNVLSDGIPESYTVMSRLHTLFLDGNFLGGDLPDLGRWPEMKNLDLSDNSFKSTVPDNFANAVSLEDLRLSSNGLTGKIPNSLIDLFNLETLWLGNNQLKSTIPAGLGRLDSLKHVGLYENKLSGWIPSFTSTFLEDLQLDSNALAGTIPFLSSTSLRTLHLERNHLEGQIPPSLGRHTNLQSLWLQDNKLTGPVPEELGNLEKLQSFGIFDNDLSGTMPVSVCDLKASELLIFDVTCEDSNPRLECSCCEDCSKSIIIID